MKKIYYDPKTKTFIEKEEPKKHLPLIQGSYHTGFSEQKYAMGMDYDESVKQSKFRK